MRKSLIFRDFLTVSPEPVDTGRVDSEDGENILDDLLGGGEAGIVVNHEPSTVLFKPVFDELATKPGEAVSVGNHNRELIALVKSFQYGPKSLSFEVEP